MSGKIERVHDPHPGYSRLLQEYIVLPGHVEKDMSLDKVDLSSPLTSYQKGSVPKIKLNIPILSAAMQAVTGPRMAIAMARLGGAGVIFSSQEIEEQAEMVRKVKEYKAGFVIPDVFSPDSSIADVQRTIELKGYSTFPITKNGKPNEKLLGYITKQDFDPTVHKEKNVRDRMVPFKRVNRIYLDEILDESNNPDLNKANQILIEGHHGSLPIVDRKRRLKYVVFKKDIREHIENPLEMVDKKKRLIVGAAIDTWDYEKRAAALIESEADFLWIVTRQGDSDYVEECYRTVRKIDDEIPIAVGNIATKKEFNNVKDLQPSLVGVGVGSGSICTTQQVVNIGRGQATAVLKVAEARDELYDETDFYIPIVSDGSVKHAIDISAALSLGADAVMVGRLVAGTDESNSELDAQKRTKKYWGEASERAKASQKKRYGHAKFPEGVEIDVPYVGPLKNHMEPIIAEVKATILSSGLKDIKEMHEQAELEVLSYAAYQERIEKLSKITSSPRNA